MNIFVSLHLLHKKNKPSSLAHRLTPVSILIVVILILQLKINSAAIETKTSRIGGGHVAVFPKGNRGVGGVGLPPHQPPPTLPPRSGEKTKNLPSDWYVQSCSRLLWP